MKTHIALFALVLMIILNLLAPAPAEAYTCTRTAKGLGLQYSVVYSYSDHHHDATRYGGLKWLSVSVDMCHPVFAHGPAKWGWYYPIVDSTKYVAASEVRIQ